MKRLLFFICTLLCANVLMAQLFHEGDLHYGVIGAGEVEVSDCNASVTSVNIPSSVTHAWEHYDEEEDEMITDSIVTYNVTSIGEWAFYNCSSLTSVTIPNSVTSIGSEAFFNCSSLTSVTIPNSVTYIGFDAFMNCSSLTSVTIPNSVTSIGLATFYGCSSLSSVNIPNSVTSIGELAFYNCSSLTSVTIPNSITSIVRGTFCNCSGLTSVTIPNSVTSIGEWAFDHCSSLTSVTIPNSVTSIGREAFYYCTGLESINLSDNITSIGRNCFDSCINLTTVNIPTSLSVIDTSLFRYCTSLTSITIPENITDIKAWSFLNCHSLTSINIPNSVTSIGDYAFAVCNTLSSVTLGNSVTSIGYATFYDCSNLSSINIPNSVTYIDDYAFRGCSSLTSIDIPNSVTSIGDFAFAVCNTLSSVTLGNSITSIGYATFYDCSNLSSINIPNSVTYIDDYAFRGCSSLTSIDIPNSVTSIGDFAFAACNTLSSVTIPNSVTAIGSAAFRYCTGLESINLSDNITSIGRNCFDSCINLTTVNIPISLSVIDTSLFRSCTSLTSVTIPENITDIKAWSFAYCNSLSSVNIPNSVTSIEYGAFGECNSLSSVTCLANTPPSLGDYVFYNTPSNKILNVNCGLKDDYISSWGNAFDSNNIFEMYQYNVVATVNNEEFGSVAVENNCSTATLSATANSGYSFLNWNDGNTENPRVVSLTSDTSFVANFGALVVNTDITATICQGQTYTENGFNVSEAGIYTQTLTAINGADSIVTLTLNVNPIYNTELTATICQGSVYTENNFNVSEAGVYTQTLTSVNGCDSIVTLTLNVNPTFNTELSANICQGQVYDENGFNVSEAGVYTQTLTSVNGCDSIVTLTLNVNPIYNTELSATICEGQVYNEQGFNVSETGVYTQTLTSANGCDSIVTLTLNVNPTFNTELSANICQGQVYNENGFNVSEAGVYTQTLTSVNGCDSIVTLTLNVNPIFNTELSANICQGQVYNENGFNVSEAGVYTQTLTSVNGCDSIVTLTLNVNPTFDTTINATINAGETYAEFGFNESEAGTYVQNLQTEAGCDSTITLVLSVNSSLLEAEIEEISFYPNPTDSKVNFSQAIEKIEVIDLTGKTILTFTNAKTINIESLPSGAYYLRLTNDEKTIMQKVIKQ